MELKLWFCSNNGGVVRTNECTVCRRRIGKEAVLAYLGCDGPEHLATAYGDHLVARSAAYRSLLQQIAQRHADALSSASCPCSYADIESDFCLICGV